MRAYYRESMSNCKALKTKKLKNTKNRGFSVIELMIVVAIVAIVAAIALPMTMGVTSSARAESYLNQVKSAINLARVTAMTQNIDTFLCPTADGLTCNTSISNGNWGDNRILVFTSSDGSLSDVDDILSVVEAPEGDDYLLWSASLGNDLRFHANGFVSTNGSMFYCAYFDDSGVYKANKRLILNRLGRVRYEMLDPLQSC